MRIDVHLHFDDARLISLLDRLEKFMAQIDDDLAALTAEVARNTTVTGSVLTFVQGVPALIQAAVDKALAAGATADQLKAVTDAAAAIKANDDAIVAAVTSGTTTAPGA